MHFCDIIYYDGIGPLTAPNGIIGQAFLSSEKVRKSGIDWADLQIYFTPFGIYKSMAEQFTRASKTKQNLIGSIVDPYIGRDAVVTSVALVRPKSVGEILLRNKNPNSSPIIDPNYLSNPEDIKVLLEGVKTTIKLFEESSSFKQFNSTMSATVVPGCEAFLFRSDEYWECTIRTLSTTVW